MPSKKTYKKSPATKVSTPDGKMDRHSSLHNDAGKPTGGAKRKGVFEGSAEDVHPKRRKGLGVRVIGGRIYDSENGRTCHQCRQKTIEYMAPCKSIIGKKPCTQNFCVKCLQNRYGEKVTEVTQVETWTCPKCRGICNCSICMKKQGRTPTGILSPMAKATGFGSVAELLQKCPNEIVGSIRSPVKGTLGDSKASKAFNDVSPRKACSAKAPAISTALGSLTNKDLSIPCIKEKQELVEECFSGAKQTSKKVDLMMKPRVHVNGVQHMNGTVNRSKVKKFNTGNQVNKGFVAAISIEEIQSGPKLTNNTQKGTKKRNTRSLKDSQTNEVNTDVKASSIIEHSGDDKVSLQSSQPMKAKKRKQKLTQKAQAAEDQNMEFPKRSCQEPIAESKSGETCVAKPVCAKKDVDGKDSMIKGKSLDLGLGESKMQSTLKSLDPLKNRKARRKLTVTINGDVEGLIACVNPGITKPKAATVNRKSKKISGQRNEENPGIAILPTPEIDLPSQALPTKAKKRKHEAVGDASTELSSVKTEEKEIEKSSVLENVQALTKRAGKKKEKAIKDAHAEGTAVKTEEEKSAVLKNVQSPALPKKARKRKENAIGDGHAEGTEVKTEGEKYAVLEIVPSQALPKKARKKKEMANGDAHAEGTAVNTEEETEQSEVNTSKSKESKQAKQKMLKSQVSLQEEEIVLPTGEQLVAVAGMEVSADVVGPALQLLEFCSAFNHVLGLKKGEAEALLREFSRGRVLRCGSQPLLTQLHVKLLSLIEEDCVEPCTVTHSSSGENSWLQVLKRHLNERSCVFVSNASKCDASDSLVTVCPPVSIIPQKDLVAIKAAIQEGTEGYKKLDMCKKLQLLTILCDDCLDTECIRNYIEVANHKYCEAQKGSREEVLAARKEAKEAKQKSRDAEVTRLLALSNINSSLTPEEKDALLSKAEREMERAVAAKSMMTEAAKKMKKGRSDAVRTDPIVLAKDGRAFYKLKGAYGRNTVVFQDISNTRLSAQDCWSVYSEEQEAILSKYLCYYRVKTSRRKGIPGEQSGSPDHEPSKEDELEVKPDSPAEADDEVLVKVC